MAIQFDVWCGFRPPWFGVLECGKNIFSMGILEEVIPEVGFGLPYCALVKVSHSCKLVPVWCSPVCLPLPQFRFHKGSFPVDVLIPPGFRTCGGF